MYNVNHIKNTKLKYAASPPLLHSLQFTGIYKRPQSNFIFIKVLLVTRERESLKENVLGWGDGGGGGVVADRMEPWQSWENSGSLRLSTQNSLTRLWRTVKTWQLSMILSPASRGTINSDSERGVNLQLNNVCWAHCLLVSGWWWWGLGGVVCYCGWSGLGGCGKLQLR